MISRGQKIKLGIFLLGAAVALAFLLIALLGVNFWRDVERYYVLVPDSVEGLERGAPVMIRGVRVGNVGDFELDPGGVPGVRVTLEIEAGTPVRADAKAFVKLQGLTGIKLVDLMEGTPSAPVLPPGSAIPHGKTALERLGTRADQIAERSLALLDRANELVGHLIRVTAAIDLQRLDATLKKADALMSKLTRAGSELNVLIADGQRALRGTSQQVSSTLHDTQRLVGGVHELTENLDRSSRVLELMLRSSRAPLQTTLHDLREATQSFKELGRSLAQDPSSLLFSKPPPERELP